MNPKISVIIPVYNSEKFLDKCIQSVLSQSYSDFELLLINDGSKDRSGEICDKYAKKDKRVKIFHQENAGVSAARNLGLDNAKGEWVSFVDSDDWVEDGYFEILLKNVSNEIDVLIFGYNKIGLTGTQSVRFNLQEELHKEDIVNLLENTADNMNVFWFPFTKVYRKELIQRVRFNANIAIGEDTIFNIEIIGNSKKIKCIGNCLYSYSHNENSATNVKYRKNLLENMICHYNSRNLVYDTIHQIDRKKIKLDTAEYYINHILFWLLNNLKNNPNKFDKKSDIKRIRESIIYTDCFPNYKYNWGGRIKQSLIIKFFELKQYKLLFKLLNINA